MGGRGDAVTRRRIPCCGQRRVSVSLFHRVLPSTISRIWFSVSDRACCPETNTAWLDSVSSPITNRPGFLNSSGRMWLSQSSSCSNLFYSHPARVSVTKKTQRADSRKDDTETGSPLYSTPRLRVSFSPLYSAPRLRVSLSPCPAFTASPRLPFSASAFHRCTRRRVSVSPCLRVSRSRVSPSRCLTAAGRMACRGRCCSERPSGRRWWSRNG